MHTLHYQGDHHQQLAHQNAGYMRFTMLFLMALISALSMADETDDMVAKLYILFRIDRTSSDVGTQRSYYIVKCNGEWLRDFELFPLCWEYEDIDLEKNSECAQHGDSLVMLNDIEIDEIETRIWDSVQEMHDLFVKDSVVLQTIKKVWSDSERTFETVTVYASPVKGVFYEYLCELNGKYYKKYFPLGTMVYDESFWETQTAKYLKIADFNYIFEKGTEVDLPTGLSPIPNTNFHNIKEKQADIQKNLDKKRNEKEGNK